VKPTIKQIVKLMEEVAAIHGFTRGAGYCMRCEEPFMFDADFCSGCFCSGCGRPRKIIYNQLCKELAKEHRVKLKKIKKAL